MTLMTETVTELPRTSESTQPNSSVDREDASGLWIARAVIVSVAAALAWHTWGHWGDFQIDNGRELYVPAEILKGKMLFRDLWYMYGPLVPYLKALLFRIFGVQLTVLYVFGLTLTFGAALLTFEVGRRFRLGAVVSAVPAIFFLVESFYTFIRNFVFPYSYASSSGALIGMACLLFVMRHASGMRTLDLAMASLLTGIAILTKQEFGMACLALVGFEIVGFYWIRRSLAELLRNSGVLPPASCPRWPGTGGSSGNYRLD